MSSTELAYLRRQLREMNGSRVGAGLTDRVLHRAFSRQTDEMARVVQPPETGEIFGVGEVSSGGMFVGLHQTVSPQGNEPITYAVVDCTHNVTADAARREAARASRRSSLAANSAVAERSR